jgi:hypothetical protein
LANHQEHENMTIRTPQPSQQAKILRNFFATQGISLRHTVALEAIARVKGYANTQAMRSDAPDDDELAAFLEAAQNPDGAKDKMVNGSPQYIQVLREALSKVQYFARDNFPNIDFEQCVTTHPSELPKGERDFSGITLTVCFESDEEKGRVAPFAYYAKRVNTSAEGWTKTPIPAKHEVVTNLSVKLLLKAIKNTGVELTAAYDESPKSEG